MAARMVLRTNSAPNLLGLEREEEPEVEPGPEPEDEDSDPGPALRKQPTPVIEDRKSDESKASKFDSFRKRSASVSSLNDLLEVVEQSSVSGKQDDASEDSKSKMGYHPHLHKSSLSSSSLNLEAMLRKTLPRSYVHRLNEIFSKASREEPLPIFQLMEGKVLTVKQVQALNRLSLLSISPPILPEKEKEKKQALPLQIQLASDLHIEMFHRNKSKTFVELCKEVIKPAAPILALLGDIGCPATDKGFKDYTQFLQLQCDRFEKVLILAGNHEYYNSGFGEDPLTVDEVKTRIRKLCKKFRNLIFLDRESVVINGVRIVGCTLWSHIPSEARHIVEKGVNDYHLIFVENDQIEGSPPSDFYCSLSSLMGDEKEKMRPLKASDTVKWHQEDLKFIQKEAEDAKRLGQPVLVLTHHTPTFNGTSNPVYRASPLRWAFSSDLESMFDGGGKGPYSAIHTWASGHTHWSCDQMIGGVHVVSNQYGYTGTAECTYKPAFVLSI